MLRPRAHGGPTVTAATVYVVRHGETPWTAAERVQGWADVPLTDHGRDQVAATGRALADAVGDAEPRLLASDLLRARESAEVLADTVPGAPAPDLDAAWRERDFGVYQGLDDERYHAVHGQVDAVDGILWAPEDGESWRDVETRVLAAWADLRRSLGDGDVAVVVTHYGPIACLLAEADDRRLSVEMRESGYEEAVAARVAVEDGVTTLLDRDLTADG